METADQTQKLGSNEEFKTNTLLRVMAFGWCGAGSRTGVPEQWTCAVNIAPTPRERVPPYRSLRNLDGIPLSLSFWTVSEEEMALETPGLTS